MPARTTQQLLRTWLTDPMSVPVYLLLATLGLGLAITAAPAEFGWTLFVVYLALAAVALHAQRTRSAR